MNAAALERRIRRVEWVNRALLMGLAVLVGGSVAWRAPQEDTLRARRIEVMDADGRARVVLAVSDEGPTVEIVDVAGVSRASLGDGLEGTALYLRDAEGVTRVGVAQFAHGGGGFALHGPRSEGAAVLYLAEEGSLTFYDEEGRVLARFPASEGG
jgi:hypothetical protein